MLGCSPVILTALNRDYNRAGGYYIPYEGMLV